MKTVIQIDGMTCGHCEAAVKKALAKVPGVRTVERVDRTAHVAEVEGDADVQALLRAIEGEGYVAAVRGTEGAGGASLRDSCGDGKA
ncbi:MAG: heavy-metal-associated domain-containing protein [Polyangiaceae bacterium]